MPSADELDRVEAQEPQQTPSIQLLPILIIPGFMSSGLEVVESTAFPSWVGRRVWINLSALGFQSLHRGSALVQNEEKDRLQGFSDEMHAEYQEQMRCKSRWVHHVSLSSDLTTERDGIKVRPLQGLKAVDYLTPGALTNLVSYVFGPVIHALEAVGYKESVNLDAAPYDWRLPPSQLERRDAYFTTTKEKVEQLYRRNNNTPVVLLCHSLGCRTAHYFLNFVKLHHGQEWIDKHIHTYLPVGAPHLGAPKALRAMVSGDKMGLDAFLSDEEGLILGRSFGSGAWLFPGQLPQNAPSNAFLRPLGTLQITLSPIDCKSLLEAREGELSTSRFRLTVELNNRKKVLATAAKSLPNGGYLLEFIGRFQFAVPVNDNGSISNTTLQIHLQERGLSKKEKKLQTGIFYSYLFCPICALLSLLSCIVQYTLLLPFTLLAKVLASLIGITVWTADKTVDAAGGYATLASTSPIAVSKLLGGNKKEAVSQVVLTHVQKYQRRARCSSKGAPRTASVSISIQFAAHPSEERIMAMPLLREPIAVQSPSALDLSFYGKDGKANYRSLRGDELLAAEGLPAVLKLSHDAYCMDPLGPRTMSSLDGPPVRRIKAIYGINLDSEVGAVYKPATLLLEDGHVSSMHVLDTSVRLPPKSTHKVVNGIVYETKSTPYVGCDGSKVHKSGDGTVPYWSLSHVQSWASPERSVHVDEIEGAEHREILANKEFHALLLDYVQVKE